MIHFNESNFSLIMPPFDQHEMRKLVSTGLVWETNLNTFQVKGLYYSVSEACKLRVQHSLPAKQHLDRNIMRIIRIIFVAPFPASPMRRMPV